MSRPAASGPVPSLFAPKGSRRPLVSSQALPAHAPPSAPGASLPQHQHQQQPLPPRASGGSGSAPVNLFHLFGGSNFVIGLAAHFYLVLVVGIVQAFLDGASSAPVAAPAFNVNASDVHSLMAGGHAEAAAAMLDPWTMSIFVLVSAIGLIGISYLARWSWPMVSEKALFTALAWMLYGVLVGNFGICFCCVGGSWAGVCGGGWYEQLTSVLWLVALAASFMVDAWNDRLRQVSLGATFVLAILLFVAPANRCSTLPMMSSLVIFLRVTLFHLIWHTNRMLRMAESILYLIYLRHVRALDEMRVPSSQDEALGAGADPLPTEAPLDIVSTWRVLCTIAHATTQDTHSLTGTGARPAFFGGSARYAAGLADPEAALSPAQLFIQTVHEARRLVPHLDHFAAHTNASNANARPRWIDWKYRHYAHTHMFVIDFVRSSWVLMACPLYLVAALAELGWLWHTLYAVCAEIVSTTQTASVSTVRPK